MLDIQEMNNSDNAPSAEAILGAIDSNALDLHVQPKASLKNDKFDVIGGEILLRWISGSSVVHSPVEIVHSAQQFGIMSDLTEFVIRQVIDIIRQCDGQNLKIPISMNLSRGEFEDSGLLDRINRLLKDANVHPSRLTIEITEESLFSNRERALEVLNELRRTGVTLSLDDFGSGFASLTDLYRLPISEVKFDRSLIGDIDSNVKARTVVKALAALMRELSLPICAEGVETRTAVEFLRSVGCQSAQGYFFSKAEPRDVFIAKALERR